MELSLLTGVKIFLTIFDDQAVLGVPGMDSEASASMMAAGAGEAMPQGAKLI